ncbi:hypothetical protein K458DRAFT_23400 [Lentithecium fluviatile CBS 122367]|uniref:Uncharacterized protein n=1 Tax=Lentithecium fluviatile CBS 122367 TaxID=1168545 RepID=A0A6G1J4B1_9PLEO|nr:hypothetical protein K458DRAFT_23400 [Lentithecium fluviatile CBS 122367]
MCCRVRAGRSERPATLTSVCSATTKFCVILIERLHVPSFFVTNLSCHLSPHSSKSKIQVYVHRVSAALRIGGGSPAFARKFLNAYSCSTRTCRHSQRTTNEQTNPHQPSPPNRQAGKYSRAQPYCLGYSSPQNTSLAVSAVFYASSGPSAIPLLQACEAQITPATPPAHSQPYNPVSRSPRLLDPILLQGIGIWSFEDHSA